MSTDNVIRNHGEPMVIARKSCHFHCLSYQEPSKTYDYSKEIVKFQLILLSGLHNLEPSETSDYSSEVVNLRVIIASGTIGHS